MCHLELLWFSPLKFAVSTHMIKKTNRLIYYRSCKLGVKKMDVYKVTAQ